MRKSSMFSMAIILVALVAMMVAADMALKPMKRTIAIGADLTAMLDARGDLEPETKVFVLARKAEPRHLATEGWGLIIEVEPAQGVRERKGRLERLARRLVSEAGRLYRARKGRRIDWYEVRFGKGTDPWHRSLMTVDPNGRIGRPAPGIPAVRMASAH